MQTARLTVLLTPDRKASIERRAAQMGVSSGEFVRLAVEQFDPERSDDSALAALAEEVNRALPAMRRSLDRSADRLEAAHHKIDALLRDMGLRQ
jgi:hypothetical protein